MLHDLFATSVVSHIIIMSLPCWAQVRRWGALRPDKLNQIQHNADVIYICKPLKTPHQDGISEATQVLKTEIKWLQVNESRATNRFCLWFHQVGIMQCCLLVTKLSLVKEQEWPQCDHNLWQNLVTVILNTSRRLPECQTMSQLDKWTLFFLFVCCFFCCFF